MSKPPIEVPQGAIRLNTDSQKLEFFAQDQWWEMATDFPNLGGNGNASTDPTGNSADQSSGARGFVMGDLIVRLDLVLIMKIRYITIPTQRKLN